MLAVRKLVSSEAAEEELRHICNGALDQVQAIALVRAFDPGAWVRIAFNVRSVASTLRGELCTIDVLQDRHHAMSAVHSTGSVKALINPHGVRVLGGQFGSFRSSQCDQQGPWRDINPPQGERGRNPP